MVNNTLLGKLFPIWLSCQTELSEVVRWKKHSGLNPKLRVQTTDKHVLSFGLVSRLALINLRHYDDYNLPLLSLAFDLHDLPEGFLKRDITWREKKAENDLAEYLAFKERFSFMETGQFIYAETAFLLQFAMKKHDIFPDDVQKKLRFIRANHKLDAMAFTALEGWEYIFYAYEGFLHHQDEFILYDGVESQMGLLQNSAKELPGFRDEIFTEDFEKWCLGILKNKPDNVEK